MENRYDDRIDMLSRYKMDKSFFYDNNDKLKGMSMSEQVKFYDTYNKSKDYIKKLQETRIEMMNQIPKTYSYDDLMNIKIYKK